MYRNKVCDLAQNFLAAGKETDAENILKDTLKQIENRTPCLLAGVTPIADSETYTNVNTILEENLALMLFQQNRLKEALPYIEKSIEIRNEYYPPAFSIMRAKCLEAESAFSAAADSYLLAAESGFSPPDLNESNYRDDYHEQLLRDALRCSQQAQDLSPEKKAQFLLALARFLEKTSLDTKAVLEIYRQAYNLLPDKNDDKVSTASQIATLESLLNSENQEHSNQQPPGESVSQEALKMRAEAARLALEQDPKLAGNLWMELAELQAQSKLLDNALQSARKALTLFSSTPLEFLSVHSLATPNKYVVLELCANKRSAEAESLLLASEEILKNAPDGIKSAKYNHFQTMLIKYYIEKKNHEKATARLNQLLSLNPRKIYLGKHPEDWSIDELVSALSAQPATTEREPSNLRYLQTILEGELKYYNADDIRIATILKAMGDRELESKHFKQAAKYYEQVLSINKLYGYEQEFAPPLWQKFKEILQAGGEKQKAESLLEKIKKEQKLKDRIDNFSVFNKSNLELQEFYSWIQSVAPYSTCATKCCDALLEQAQAAKRWREVAIFSREGLNKIWHQSDLGSYSCEGLRQPIAQRAKYYKSLLKAYLAMNQKEKATQVLKEVQAGQSYNPTIEELVFLASIYDIGGDKENALNYCKQAREQLMATPNQDQFRDDINRLWQKTDY
jgi:tetratricopeptide (TPR) repeat protein